MHIKNFKVQSPIYFTTRKVTITVPVPHARKPFKAEAKVVEEKAPKTVTAKARKNTPKAKKVAAAGTTTS